MFAWVESPPPRGQLSRICRVNRPGSFRGAMRVGEMEKRHFFSRQKRMTMLDALVEAFSAGVKLCIQEYYLLLMAWGECKPSGSVSMV